MVETKILTPQFHKRYPYNGQPGPPEPTEFQKPCVRSPGTLVVWAWVWQGETDKHLGTVNKPTG